MANSEKLWYTIDLAAKLSKNQIKELEIKLPEFLEFLGISDYHGPEFEAKTESKA